MMGLTVKKLAEMLDVTERTVYNWIEVGLPAEKLGAKWYILDGWKDWLKERGK